MTTIRIDAGEAGTLVLSRATRDAFREYYDAQQDERPADAFRGLWASCAVEPPAAEVASLVADFDALPTFIASELAKEAGWAQGYERIPLEKLPADALQGAKTGRRPPVAYQTPAGLLLLRQSGGGDAYVDGKAQANAGKGSHYDVARALLLARACVPDAAALAAAIEQHPALPVVLELELVGMATGGKVPARC